MSANERRPDGGDIRDAGRRSASNATGCRIEYALLVTAERSDHVTTKQLFTTLGAAERKVKRTRDRGLHAGMALVRIAPVAGYLPEHVVLIGGEEREFRTP